MADESGPIPTGCSLETKVQKDGKNVSYYCCLATGQHFYTYADMIRYVNYARETEFSTYSPKFTASKRRYKALFSGRRKKPSSLVLETNSSDQSVKTPDLEETTNPEDIEYLEETTDPEDTFDPDCDYLVDTVDLEDSADLKETTYPEDAEGFKETNDPEHDEILEVSADPGESQKEKSSNADAATGNASLELNQVPEFQKEPTKA